MQAPHRDGQYFNLGTPTELWPLWTFWRFDHLLQLISLSAFAMLRRPLLVCWCQLYASARQEPGPRPCWRCLQSPRCHRNVIAMQSQCREACCHVLAVQCHGRSCFHAAFHALDLLRCRSDHCRINANLFEGRRDRERSTNWEMYSTILRQITAVIRVDDMVKERRESTFALSLPDHSFHKSSIFLCCEATSD